MRVEPTSPKENHGDVSWVVSTPSSPVLVTRLTYPMLKERGYTWEPWMLTGPRDGGEGGSLPYGRYLLAPVTGN